MAILAIISLPFERRDSLKVPCSGTVAPDHAGPPAPDREC